MRTLHASLRKTSALFALLAFASVARAADKAPADWRNTMTTTAKNNNIPSYERTLPNGTKRVYLNPQQQHLNAVDQTLPKGSDVIEIMHIGTAEAFHTMAIFDRELLHSQFSQAGNWRLRSWGDRLRPSGTKLWSAMISLNPREAANLRQRIAAAKVEEGPENLAGANWENGHLKMGAGSALGVNGINCVAAWCDMPIGERGEPSPCISSSGCAATAVRRARSKRRSSATRTSACSASRRTDRRCRASPRTRTRTRRSSNARDGPVRLARCGLPLVLACFA